MEYKEITTFEDAVSFLIEGNVKKNLERKMVTTEFEDVRFVGPILNAIQSLKDFALEKTEEGFENIRIKNDSYENDYGDCYNSYTACGDRLETDAQYLKRLKNYAKKLENDRKSKAERLTKEQEKYLKLHEKLSKLHIKLQKKNKIPGEIKQNE